MRSESSGPPADARVLSPGAGALLLAAALAIIAAGAAFVRVGFEAGPIDPTNGLPIAPSLVDPAAIERAVPIGQLRPLDDPAPIAAASAAELAGFLVTTDRVAVVSIGGETRAYPLRVLAYHEVANDTLGGAPIAVVHQPVSDLVAVLDRRVGSETLRFGASGLLLDSHLLLFDRPTGDDMTQLAASSLWSPLLARAIAGARAGAPLRLLPCEVTTWGDYRTRFPEGTIPTPLPAYRREYRKEPYNTYVGAGRLRYRVDPLPPGSRALFTPMLIVELADGGSFVEAIPELLEHIETPSHEIATAAGTLRLRVVDRERAVVTATGEAVRSVRQAWWFAWYAAEAQELGE